MGWPPEDVKPLPKSKRVEPARERPAPHPRQTRLDEKAVLRESLGPILPEDALDAGEDLAFSRSGSRDVLRKLRRGHWVVQDELDLHGFNRHDALAFTREFFGNAKKRQLRCVRVIHGKGLGSPNRESVLKAMLRRWLPQQLDVLAFAQAPAAQGGSGAVLVLLRS